MKYKKYLFASVNLYGALTLNDFNDIYYHYEKEYVDKKTLHKELESLVNDFPYFIHYNKNIITSGFYDINDSESDLIRALDLIESLRDVPFNLLEKNEFLKYEDDGYFESRKSVNNLIKFVNDNNIFKEPYENCIAEHLEDYVMDVFLLGAHESFLKRLKRIGFKFKNKTIENKFEELLLETTDDKRFFLFKGHTFEDYFEKYLDFNKLEQTINFDNTDINKDYLKLIDASTNLYGFLSNDDIKFLINYYYNKDLNKEDLESIIDFFITKVPFTYKVVNDKYLVGIHFDKDEGSLINELAEKRESFNIYLPKLNILLKYQNPTYDIENKRFNNLISLIMENNLSPLKEDELEPTLITYILSCKAGYNVDSIKDMLQVIDISSEMDLSMIDTLINNILNVLNNIRLFELYGNTEKVPKEKETKSFVN